MAVVNILFSDMRLSTSSLEMMSAFFNTCEAHTHTHTHTHTHHDMFSLTLVPPYTEKLYCVLESTEPSIAVGTMRSKGCYRHCFYYHGTCWKGLCCIAPIIPIH